MVKKLIQACAVFIAVTAIIYGNKPIQQGQAQQSRDTLFYQTPGLHQGRGGGGGTF